MDVCDSKTLTIIHAIPKIKAFANSIMEKEYEKVSNYQCCDILFMNTGSIHTIQSDIAGLYKYCEKLNISNWSSVLKDMYIKLWLNKDPTNMSVSEQNYGSHSRRPSTNIGTLIQLMGSYISIMCTESTIIESVLRGDQRISRVN